MIGYGGILDNDGKFLGSNLSINSEIKVTNSVTDKFLSIVGFVIGIYKTKTSLGMWIEFHHAPFDT